MPTASNTHEVAQAAAPECRIVYVDNDPLVLVHARALLTSTPEGITDYVDADVGSGTRVAERGSTESTRSVHYEMVKIGTAWVVPAGKGC